MDDSIWHARLTVTLALLFACVSPVAESGETEGRLNATSNVDSTFARFYQMLYPSSNVDPRRPRILGPTVKWLPKPQIEIPEARAAAEKSKKKGKGVEIKKKGK